MEESYFAKREAYKGTSSFEKCDRKRNTIKSAGFFTYILLDFENVTNF